MASYDFERGEIDFIDAVNIVSLLIGLENLDLNQKQVDGIMAELKDNQNALLQVIIKQNEEILALLKELKSAKNSENR